MVMLNVLFDFSVLQELKDQMLPLCVPISRLAMGIAALGALWSIATIVFDALSKTEAVDYYKLLRPFAIAMCIVSFDVLVIGALDAVLYPVGKITAIIAESQVEETDELQSIIDKTLYETPLTEEEVLVFQSFTTQKGDVLEEKEPNSTPAQSMKDLNATLKAKKTAISTVVMACLTEVIAWLLNLISGAATMGIGIASTFMLIILSILGPLSFAASCFPAFESSLSSWLARYISISLWIPIGHLFGAMMSRIQLISLQFQANNLEEGVPAMSGVLTICISIVAVYGMLSIPSIADWIVQSGGTGSYSKNMSSGANKAGGAAADYAGGRLSQGVSAAKSYIKNKFKGGD